MNLIDFDSFCLKLILELNLIKLDLNFFYLINFILYYVYLKLDCF